MQRAARPRLRPKPRLSRATLLCRRRVYSFELPNPGAGWQLVPGVDAASEVAVSETGGDLFIVDATGTVLTRRGNGGSGRCAGQG